MRAFSEFNAPFGVPDVTALVGPSTRRHERLRLEVDPLLNEIDAGIVSKADTERPQTPKQIAHRLRWELDSVERRLPEVIRTGALIETEPGKFVKPKGLAPLGDLYALETKVKDWRRALQQCRTYLLWADSYVLVLDRLSESAKPALVEAVKQDRGGLVVGGETLRHAAVSRRREARRLWASEHVVAELLARKRR